VTAENQPQRWNKNEGTAAAAPKAVLKPQETAEVAAANEKKKGRAD
jgi:hypothetical protein